MSLAVMPQAGGEFHYPKERDIVMSITLKATVNAVHLAALERFRLRISAAKFGTRSLNEISELGRQHGMPVNWTSGGPHTTDETALQLLLLLSDQIELPASSARTTDTDSEDSE